MAQSLHIERQKSDHHIYREPSSDIRKAHEIERCFLQPEVPFEVDVAYYWSVVLLHQLQKLAAVLLAAVCEHLLADVEKEEEGGDAPHNYHDHGNIEEIAFVPGRISMKAQEV